MLVELARIELEIGGPDALAIVEERSVFTPLLPLKMLRESRRCAQLSPFRESDERLDAFAALR